MQHFLRIILISGLIFSVECLWAQPSTGGPCGMPGQPPCDPGPPPVPLSGIEILVGAGALLGAKRFLANRKQIEQGSGEIKP
jgi:hypothetical protein